MSGNNLSLCLNQQRLVIQRWRSSEYLNPSLFSFFSIPSAHKHKRSSVVFQHVEGFVSFVLDVHFKEGFNMVSCEGDRNQHNTLVLLCIPLCKQAKVKIEH